MTPSDEATPGTGQWLLYHDKFRQWERGGMRVLYCPGDR